MDAAAMTVVMPAAEPAPEPEVYQALLDGRKVTKQEALDHLKALERNETVLVDTSIDPDTQRGAQDTAASCATLISSISARKDLEKNPVDVDVELSALIDKAKAARAARLGK